MPLSFLYAHFKQTLTQTHLKESQLSITNYKHRQKTALFLQHVLCSFTQRQLARTLRDANVDVGNFLHTEPQGLPCFQSHNDERLLCPSSLWLLCLILSQCGNFFSLDKTWQQPKGLQKKQKTIQADF